MILRIIKCQLYLLQVNTNYTISIVNNITLHKVIFVSTQYVHNINITFKHKLKITRIKFDFK